MVEDPPSHKVTASSVAEQLAARGAMPNHERKPPTKWCKGLDSADKEVSGYVVGLLLMLNYYVRCFEAAVQLFEIAATTQRRASDAFKKDRANIDAAADLEIVDGWVVIAARDGAMSIYHFGCTMDGLVETMGKAPGLRTKYGRPLKLVRKQFEEAFPSFFKVRHAIAHSAERNKSPEKIEEHSLVGPWKTSRMEFTAAEGVAMSGMLTDVLDNRTWSSTWDGQVVSYEISVETLANLVKFRDEIYLAFSESPV